MARRRLSAWVVWAAGAVVLLFLAVSVQKVWSADFWGNLLVGERILERGEFPTVEENTFSAPGRALVEVRWLYCMLTALAWRAGEWVTSWSMAVVLGLTWAVVVWPSRRIVTRPGALGVIALGLAAGSARWVHRPELFTGVCLAAFLVGLEHARRGRVGWAWWLAAVQVLWVNSHSLFMLGPALAWMFAGAAMLERLVGRGEAWKGLTGVAAAVTGACWVNPYFHEGAMYALVIVRETQNATADVMTELVSPLAIPIGAWRWDLWAMAGLVVVAAVLQALNWRRVGLARWGVLALMVYLAASAQRSAGLVAIIGVWGALRDLEGVGQKWVVKEWARRAALAGVGVAALGAAWFQASDRAWTTIGVGRETGVGKVEWDLARGAVEFLDRAGVVRVFNALRDGYYLSWKSQGKIKVFIHGRTDVLGAEVTREYAGVGPATWEAFSRKWGIDAAVVTVRGWEGLIAHLVKRPEWALVYLDHRNVVFVRRGTGLDAVVAAHEIDPAKPWEGDSPDESVSAWKKWIGAEERPWYSFGMAQTFLALGAYGNAEEFLERTLERVPRHERALAELAAVYRFDGRQEEGDQVFGRLNAGSEWARYSERILANRLMDAGRREEAVEAMARAIQHGERNPMVMVTLGDWLFSAGEFSRAAEWYENAAAAGVDTAAEWKKLGYAREQTGDVQGAAEAYRRSLARDGEQHEVWYLLGLNQQRRGDRESARESLKRAVAIKPDFAGARRALEALGR